jgi:uncharacterized membrane protein
MIDLVTIARGTASPIVEPWRIVVRNLDEWRALWRLHAGPASEVPAVDFSTRMVAGAFSGEKPSAGYSIEITGAFEEPGAVRLFVEERKPGPGMVAAQVLSAPFHVVSLPRFDGEIRWSGAAAAQSGGGGSDRPDGLAPLPNRLAQTGSSTGLAPRTASALAYLAGPFSGALILVVESRNPDVRFHAWQSIIALGSLGLAVALGYFTAVASLFISATAVSLIVRISTAIWVALLIVWVLCLWKALAGGRWKLPLAGDWAERAAAHSWPQIARLTRT